MKHLKKSLAAGLGTVVLAMGISPMAFAQEDNQNQEALNGNGQKAGIHRSGNMQGQFMQADKENRERPNLEGLSFEEKKALLLERLEKGEEHITQMIESVEANEKLSDEAKAKRLEHLNTNLAELPNKISELQAVTSEEELFALQKARILEGLNKAQENMTSRIAEVEANTELSDEKKEKILEHLNTRLEELPSIKEQVENATSQEDLPKKPLLKGKKMMKKGKKGNRQGEVQNGDSGWKLDIGNMFNR